MLMKMRVIPTTVLVCLLTSAGADDGGIRHDRIGPAEYKSGPRQWEVNPLTWRFDAATRGFRVAGPDGFAVAGSTNFACVRVSARITPVRTGTNEWSTLGVSLFNDERNFWHAALVQAPSDAAGGGRRFFELVEMRNGRWLSEHADRLRTTRAHGDGVWRPGASYVVSIACTPEGVSARACDAKGKLLWERGYAFTPGADGKAAKAVTCGRPALRTTGCFHGDFSDISQTCSDPCPRTAERSFPPYASDSFVPGVTDKATGFFRLIERDGRWWVIDPLGRGAVLLGIDHVTYHGHYSRRTNRGHHHEFNRVRFPNKSDWETDTLGRLKAWGFNALGAGCDPALEHRGLVHTRFLSLGDALCRTSWQDADADLFICPNERRPCSAFPNVFHPSFPMWADYVARRKCAPNRTDPWLFGYFIDNELAWWGRGARDTGLFEAVARLPEGHSAKAAQRRFLAERGVTGEASAAVKLDFLKLAAERYFSISCAAIRRHDPNHLVLGARFAGLGGAHPAVWEASAKHCDVVTFNCYPWADLDRNVMMTHRGGNARRITDAFSELYDRLKRPMLVTEWSFPALDSGLPCTGGAGQRFRTQDLRTQATELFARTMLSLPFLVGYDYFMWVDQPPEGISDEFPEDSNYGLINENGVAYPEITSMFTRLHANLGAVRAAGLPAERTGFAPEGETARRFLDRVGCAGAATQVRMGDRYTIRNAAGLELAGRVGGRRIFETVKLNGRLLGAYTGMWSELRGESPSWHDAGKVLSADWREENGRGVLRVTCEGRSSQTRVIRQTHDITVFADRPWFLCDLVSLANAGTEPVEVKEFYFREYPSFALEDGSHPAQKSVPNLWKATACARWLSQAGDAYYGGCSFAPAVTQFRYWLMDGKSRHPDAAFAPDARLVLHPGSVYRPEGRMWMLALCGLDGERGWSGTLRNF